MFESPHWVSSFVLDLLTSHTIILSFLSVSDLNGPYGKFLYIIEDFEVSCHILCGLSMLFLYYWCRNVGDPHFFDIALVGAPWRVGSRAMKCINPMSLSSTLNPSSRKRIRSDLSNSDDDHVYSEDEQEDNPSTADVNYPRFIVLKPIRSHESLTKLSPFAVAKSIQGLYGAVKQVSRLKDGSLLIEASRHIQAKHILDTHRFLDIDVDAEAHRSLYSSRGVIRDYHQDLQDMSNDEIKKELASQGVTKVSRFILKKDNKEIKTNTLFLNFDSHKPPEKIKIGYYIVNVNVNCEFRKTENVYLDTFLSFCPSKCLSLSLIYCDNFGLFIQY